MVRRPDIFLMDEPLSNLDAKLRVQTRAQVSQLQDRLGTTMVYVTHDQTEAMTLGDRVAVLRRGLLQQVASPRELYEQPVNLFVAGFIGSPPMNFLPAAVEGGKLNLPFVSFDVPSELRSRLGEGDLFIVGLRPESFEDKSVVDESKLDRGVSFSVDVDVIEWLGNEQYAYVPYDAPPEVAKQLAELQRELDSEQLRTQMVVALDPMSRISDGSRAELWFDPRRIHVFDPRSGENLTRNPAKVQQ